MDSIMNSIVVLNDDTFGDLVFNSNQKLPVLVKFGAPWCGPCHRQLTILKRFAEDFSDKIKVCLIDIEESPKTTSQYNIRSVPTLILFKDGKLITTRVGLTPLEVLETDLTNS